MTAMGCDYKLGLDITIIRLIVIASPLVSVVSSLAALQEAISLDSKSKRTVSLVDDVIPFRRQQ